MSGHDGGASAPGAGLFARVLARLRGRPAAPRPASCVLLRDTGDADGTRYLAARRNAGGDVVIEGRDWGDGVERVLGDREYEWSWTIRAANVPTLQRALGVTGDPLPALERRFAGPAAGTIATFLEENDIPTEWWSRQGD